MSYENDCNMLGGIILEIIPENLGIMDIENPFDLFKYPAFCEKTKNLDMTLAMASGALHWARRKHAERHDNGVL